jgi:quinol-cytochrome oxidoreductase complex cytochrome b subunit
MDAVGAPDTGLAAPSSPAADRWRRAFLVSLGVMGLLVSVLAVTGLSLLGSYQPTAPGASAPLDRGLHQVAATLLQAVVLLAAVCALGWSYATGRTEGRRTWIGAAVVLALVMAASVSGDRLPFDGLGLGQVAVATTDGVWPAAFDGSVRFVAIDGREVASSAYRRDVLLHLAAGSAVVVGLAALARSVRGGRSRSGG